MVDYGRRSKLYFIILCLAFLYKNFLSKTSDGKISPFNIHLSKSETVTGCANKWIVSTSFGNVQDY